MRRRASRHLTASSDAPRNVGSERSSSRLETQAAFFILPARIHAVQTRTYMRAGDRKSTRLNSSHVAISYAVFCLKKKNSKNRSNCWSQIHLVCQKTDSRHVY